MNENAGLTEVVYLGLGSNLGDRIDYLSEARRLIGENPALSIQSYSAILETPPYGRADQPDFLNQILKVRASLGPEELLSALQGIERTLGRERYERWGPRTIDIDILLYGNRVVDFSDLKIPHPGLLERPFFVRLMAELDAGITDPVTGRPLADLMNEWGESEFIASGKPYKKGALC